MVSCASRTQSCWNRFFFFWKEQDKEATAEIYCSVCRISAPSKRKRHFSSVLVHRLGPGGKKLRLWWRIFFCQLNLFLMCLMSAIQKNAQTGWTCSHKNDADILKLRPCFAVKTDSCWTMLWLNNAIKQWCFQKYWSVTLNHLKISGQHFYVSYSFITVKRLTALVHSMFHRDLHIPVPNSGSCLSFSLQFHVFVFFYFDQQLFEWCTKVNQSGLCPFVMRSCVIIYQMWYLKCRDKANDFAVLLWVEIMCIEMLMHHP